MSASLPERLVERIHAEYREMPGMRLTLEQAQRLFGIERTLCQTVLGSLVDAKRLYVSSEGCYGRARDDETSRPPPATEDLGLERRFEKAS